MCMASPIPTNTGVKTCENPMSQMHSLGLVSEGKISHVFLNNKICIYIYNILYIYNIIESRWLIIIHWPEMLSYFGIVNPSNSHPGFGNSVVVLMYLDLCLDSSPMVFYKIYEMHFKKTNNAIPHVFCIRDHAWTKTSGPLPYSFDRSIAMFDS